MEIERQSFAEPWDEVEFHREEMYGRVIEFAGEVAGYMFYEIFTHSFEIYNIAIEKRFRRNGLASAMVSRLIKRARDGKRRRVMTYVNSGSRAGIYFFQTLGFQSTNTIVGRNNSPMVRMMFRAAP